MTKEIQNKRKNKAQLYNCFLNEDWNSLKNSVQIVTSFILKMEEDEMRIEYIFIELFKSVTLLKNGNTQISKDLMNELESTYVKSINLVVPLSAFLLSPSEADFWMNNCSDRYRSFFLSVGWISIVYFCCSSDIKMNVNIYDCFIQKPFEFK